jgi:hypothetical protein
MQNLLENLELKCKSLKVPAEVRLVHRSVELFVFAEGEIQLIQISLVLEEETSSIDARSVDGWRWRGSGLAAGNAAPAARQGSDLGKVFLADD